MAILPARLPSVNSQVLQDETVAELLSPTRIAEFSRQVGHPWRSSFWSPYVTFLTFLLQVLDGAKTLRSAVALLQIHLAVHGGPPSPSSRQRALRDRAGRPRKAVRQDVSPDPSAYCQARQRLPLGIIQRALQAFADHLWRTANAHATWRGRRVWVVDGSSASMPDTGELQKTFPQPSEQRPGCGFPRAKFVMVFCQATGAVAELAAGCLNCSELTLFRCLWHRFAPGEVVLADRAYGSYTDLARLRERGVFGVFRLHQTRRADFRAGRCLGPRDRLVTWSRPAWRPSFGLSRAEFQSLPPTLDVRLVRIEHALRGFRNRRIVVVTTLLDPQETPPDEIRALYRCRWTAELNFRSLKTHLGMDILRGQSVDVVSKEMAMHVLVYNLTRLLMWRVAREQGQNPQRLSFTGTLHRLRHALPMLLFGSLRSAESRTAVVSYLLYAIATDLLPDRPNRIEPRRRKRRPKQHPLLMHPRQHYKPPHRSR